MQSSFVIFHLLAHLLFLVSHSFQSEVPGSGKVIAWTSSALFAYFRDITCPSSLFTLPPEQRIIYEAILLHSPALNRNISCRQHLPLLPTASGPLQRKMCPNCFSSPMFTCPLPALLAANDSYFWWLWPMWAWWWHSPALPASHGVPVPLALPSPCRGAVLQPQRWAQGCGGYHLHELGVWHLPAGTLFSGTSLRNWALQCLQVLRVVVAVFPFPHALKFSSLLCIGWHKSPLASSTHIFQTHRGRSRPAVPFSAASNMSFSEILSQGLWVEVWHEPAAGWPGAVIDPLL